MSNASIGYGSKYEIFNSLDTPPAYVEVAEVFNITPPSFEADRVEVTHMQSPDRTREYVPGLITPGTASFEMNFVPGSASDQMIRALQIAGTVSSHRITFPNGVTFTYQASIQTYEPDDPTDDRMTATVNINVSGNIVQGIET